ncbi:MAG: site-specific DNA-methyltransferase, partial [Candidatus Devosia euplotis]|nr:site-specific DNA-methyltransferase [Candidatus Devosia euplotis]
APETSGRYHTNWLNMMYPRLLLARNLLRDDGLIFVSIDDREVHNLRHLLDEVFGPENFQGTIVVQSNKRGQTYREIAKTHEYLLVYGREEAAQLFELDKPDATLPFRDARGPYDLWELRNRNPRFGPHNRPNLHFPIYACPERVNAQGHAPLSLRQDEAFCLEIRPVNSVGEAGCWRWGREKVGQADLTSEASDLVAKQVRGGRWNVYQKSRKTTTRAKSLWTESSVISEQGTVELRRLGLAGAFDHPKPLGLLQKVLQISTREDDLVLDFFAGSASLGHALWRANAGDGGRRRFILVQIPGPVAQQGFRSLADVARERLRRAAQQIDEDVPPGVRDGLDLGFRSYCLGESNFRSWDLGAGELDAGLLDAVDRIRPGSTEDGMLAELALGLGFDLSAPVSAHAVEGVIVHLMDGGRLAVCLHAPLSPGLVEGIAALKRQVPSLARVVFRDGGFPDDATKLGAL